MFSSTSLTPHVLHSCSVVAILKYLHQSNAVSPPAGRVVLASGLVLLAAILNTGLSFVAKNWTAGAGVGDTITNVRKKSRKSPDAGNQIEADSGSALIELSAKGKLGKEEASQVTVTLIAFSLILHLVLVILGSPPFRYWERTAALSVVIAVLTVVPVFHVTIDSRRDRRLDRVFADMVLIGESGSRGFWVRTHTVSVWLGAWIGSLALKLDWKSEWQEYPVPSLTAALAASLLSHVTYLTHVVVRRLLLSANY